MKENIFRKIVSPAGLMIILLTISSNMTISKRTIYPDVPSRIKIESSILSGEMEPPYQYRILKPLTGNMASFVIWIFTDDILLSHTLAYQAINFFVFLGIYILLYRYLRNFFSVNTCILGMLLLLAVIPLGITSIWEEGDYITLLFYLAGLNLMFSGKDKYLPLVFAIGALNREQMIFLITFYIAYLVYMNKVKESSSIRTIILSIVSFTIFYYLPRFVFGFKESVYTVTHNVTTNIKALSAISELWIAQIIVFLLLSIITYKKSNLFFRWCLIFFTPYVCFFFVFAIVTQLAKFLPAYLVLIPMSLQFLTGEYTGAVKSKPVQTPETERAT